MRRVPSYHCQGEIVNALEDSDFKKMKTVFDEAAAAWIAEWQKQGSTDEGSCCGGKGILQGDQGPPTQRDKLYKLT